MKRTWLVCLFVLQSAWLVGQDRSEQLVSWMTGSFSSEEQSKSDTSYFDIRLEIVRIWPEKKGEAWLYVEQAMASKKDKPYRQRVYRVRKTGENVYESAIYMLADPLRFAGHPEAVAVLPIDSLQLKDGCAVLLHWDDARGGFVGATGAKSCPSDLRGASYATSEVELSENMLLSWDRGFNAEGVQVWGAEKGGYRFVKKK
jgi:CpeT protein